MTLYNEKGCKHNRGEGVYCSFCEYEQRFNSDGYGPAKEYYGKEVEDYGAMWWYTQTQFWMEKFFETNKANEELRAENDRMREVLKDKEGG